MKKQNKHNNKDVPFERQMLYILRSYGSMQEELVECKRLLGEYQDKDNLAWQNARLRTRLEKGQGKYDRLKNAYVALLKRNNIRKEIMKSVWDMVPDDIKRKFEQNDTEKFEDMLERIDNEEVM